MTVGTLLQRVQSDQNHRACFRTGSTHLDERHNIGLTVVEFRAPLTLVRNSANTSAGEVAIKDTPNSITTYDINSGEGSSYADGNAQDGLYWESTEKGAGRVQLGRAARLKPSELSSASYRPNIPPTEPALKAAGYEDLIVTRQGLKVWTRVKNQATRLYVSSHGIRQGGLSVDGPGAGDFNAVQPHWNAGNLDLAIFAGCSVLDIGGFNNWNSKFNTGLSPGKRWKEAARPAGSRPGTLFLGYNATAPLSNTSEPAGSLHADTRVLAFYYEQRQLLRTSYSGQELEAMAWLIANVGMEQRIADDACAITDDYYYFVKIKAFNAKGKLIDDPHAQNDDGSYSPERCIWRVHRNYWTRVGDTQFQLIPLGPSGKTKMRQLPSAKMGESNKGLGA